MFKILFAGAIAAVAIMLVGSEPARKDMTILCGDIPKLMVMTAVRQAEINGQMADVTWEERWVLYAQWAGLRQFGLVLTEIRDHECKEN